MSKVIVFRVDSSFKIATGHVMRCLTLAKYLSKHRDRIVFICRDLDGNISERITKEGFELKLLPKPKSEMAKSGNEYDNWFEVSLEEDVMQVQEILAEFGTNITLIIDHYSIDQKWHRAIRGFVDKIVVIDDLANRPHDCDIIIDQNLYHNFEHRYDDLVPANSQKFLGQNYAILREQFYDIEKRKRSQVKNILIFFGGIDLDNFTLQSINAVLEVDQNECANFNVIVIGAKNNYQQEITDLCIKHKFEYKSYVDNMAEVMNWADLSIGAGGTTSWERCYLNLPAIIISLADNQNEICQTLSDFGMARYLGNSQNVVQKAITSSLLEIYNDFNFQMLDCPSKLPHLVKQLL
ncbi:MAG: UDP-2,4-diacetamido-2,4,6-trideoxy-beta-L-altropyranose hydrolase [Rickettsiales bacterium]|jgi:UDP-2,4-diacetamido-2,4,6-trideoxy-beta-L-altropyranose hydrolase|nr:UDP-2,4-diacetamido-2,4,6-trideoxy-beta-L-altropyranose hydrolase [Rickettsiales bacterium]